MGRFPGQQTNWKMINNRNIMQKVRFDHTMYMTHRLIDWTVTLDNQFLHVNINSKMLLLAQCSRIYFFVQDIFRSLVINHGEIYSRFSFSRRFLYWKDFQLFYFIFIWISTKEKNTQLRRLLTDKIDRKRQFLHTSNKYNTRNEMDLQKLFDSLSSMVEKTSSLNMHRDYINVLIFIFPFHTILSMNDLIHYSSLDYV
jgi:hypothetical protein